MAPGSAGKVRPSGETKLATLRTDDREVTSRLQGQAGALLDGFEHVSECLFRTVHYGPLPLTIATRLYS